DHGATLPTLAAMGGGAREVDTRAVAPLQRLGALRRALPGRADFSLVTAAVARPAVNRARRRVDAGGAALGKPGLAGDRAPAALTHGLAVELRFARSVASAAMVRVLRDVDAPIAAALESLVAHDATLALVAHGPAVLGRIASATALATVGERRVEIHALPRAVGGAPRARVAASAQRADLAERAARVALSAVSRIAEDVHALSVTRLEPLAALDAARSGVANGGAVRHARTTLTAPTAVLGIR